LPDLFDTGTFSWVRHKLVSDRGNADLVVVRSHRRIFRMFEEPYRLNSNLEKSFAVRLGAVYYRQPLTYVVIRYAHADSAMFQIADYPQNLDQP
jgi:hypothetical protein